MTRSRTNILIGYEIPCALEMINLAKSKANQEISEEGFVFIKIEGHLNNFSISKTNY